MNAAPLHAPANNLSAIANTPVQLARRRNDPILEELWAIKAQINAEANYDIDRLVEMARIAAAPYIDENGRVRVPTPASRTPLLPAREH